MAQVIHTGKGLQAPQVRGYALQALSQFGQQEQARKTADIKQSYKDRDAFAEMLKMDPVYASSEAAQNRIGKIMDGYIDEMTMMNKERQGPMTTEDLVKMQQARGRAMAHMGYIKSASDEFVQSSQAYNAAPWKYDDKTWGEYQQSWLEDGVKHDGPPLVPAVQDPFMSGMNLLRSAGFQTDETNSFIKKDGGREQWQKTSRWDLKGQEPEDVSVMLSGNPSMQWNIQSTFDRSDDMMRQPYIDRTGGDEESAANLWYTEEMSDKLRGEESGTFYKRPPSTAQYGGTSITFSNGALWDGKYKVFDTVENVPVADATLDNAVVFSRPQSKKNPVSVPTRLLELPEGVEAKGGDVSAIVHAADNDKTYFIIDRRSLDNVKFTKKAMEAYPKGIFETDPDNPGYYKIKEDAEDEVVIPASTGSVKSLIDSWTGGKFSDALKMLPEKTNSAGGQVDLMGL